MRVVLQRVSSAKVEVDEKLISHIERGLVVLLGIEDRDTFEDIEWLVNKIAKLRIFNDEYQIMNLSLQNIDADLLVVSQFTLHASTKKGNRPSYIRAAKTDKANNLYEKFIEQAQIVLDKPISKGIFGAEMQVSLCNDGPVTIIIDSHDRQ